MAIIFNDTYVYFHNFGETDMCGGGGGWQLIFLNVVNIFTTNREHS